MMMVQATEIVSLGSGGGLIESYGGGGFTIGGEFRLGSLMVSGEHIVSWAVGDFGGLSADDFGLLFEPPLSLEGIELLMLGCGEVMILPPIELRDFFIGRGIALDFMSTGSAVRSYNIALLDGRKVGACLLAVG